MIQTSGGIMVEREIPGTIIGKLAKIFEFFYSHSDIDGTFLAAGTPQEVITVKLSKKAKVIRQLENINRQYKAGKDIKPLEILGRILEDFMDENTIDYEGIDPWEKDRNDIRETLANHGLSYVKGGRIKECVTIQSSGSIMVEREIPGMIIGKLAKIFEGFCTHSDIDSIFLAAGAPQEVTTAKLSKKAKVIRQLENTNRQYKAGKDIKPLEILGRILEDFMDKNTIDYEGIDPWEKDRNDICETLANHGLSYVKGGRISDGTPVPANAPSRAVSSPPIAEGRVVDGKAPGVRDSRGAPAKKPERTTVDSGRSGAWARGKLPSLRVFIVGFIKKVADKLEDKMADRVADIAVYLIFGFILSLSSIIGWFVFW